MYVKSRSLQRPTIHLFKFITDERLRTPHPLNVLKPDISKANPKSGVVQLEFNHTGTALLARFGALSYL